MSEANNVQHGGSHYRSAYQHWDLVHRVGLGYYAGCASKYLARHWKKNGREDLLKASHFLQKWIELIECGAFPYPPYSSRSRAHSELKDFFNENVMMAEDFSSERDALKLICAPENLRDLQNALQIVRSLISWKYPRDETPTEPKESPARTAAPAAPVSWGSPLDDFYSEGYLGGGDQGQDMYQCRHCGAHVQGPAGLHPLSYHNCKSRPLYIIDTGVPGPGYVNQ